MDKTLLLPMLLGVILGLVSVWLDELPKKRNKNKRHAKRKNKHNDNVRS